ncbi:MAG TPA: hypothetical protein VHD90_18970 [Phototrophicaceae bacterium]|nr:hypothetical protein [Phototrophicaceae bacterium]
MSKWSIIPANDEAAVEAASLFENQEIKRHCMRALNALAKETNPAEPQNMALNVKWVEHDAPSWYRLRIEWNQETEEGNLIKVTMRIFFSLAYASGRRLVEYQAHELPFDNTDNYIRIEQIGHRTADTYREARRRWRKAHGK